MCTDRKMRNVIDKHRRQTFSEDISLRLVGVDEFIDTSIRFIDSVYVASEVVETGDDTVGIVTRYGQQTVSDDPIGRHVVGSVEHIYMGGG